MIEIIYGLVILALPFFTGWAIYKINKLTIELATLRNYQKSDHRTFMVEADIIYRRLNQLEDIAHTCKKKSD